MARSGGFVQALYDVVSDPSTDDVVHWTQDGTSFIIEDQDVFVKRVMGSVCRSTKYSSFARQLNGYGFTRQHDRLDHKKLRVEHCDGAFRRGDEAALALLKRRAIPGRDSCGGEDSSGSAATGPARAISKSEKRSAPSSSVAEGSTTGRRRRASTSKSSTGSGSGSGSGSGAGIASAGSQRETKEAASYRTAAGAGPARTAEEDGTAHLIEGTVTEGGPGGAGAGVAADGLGSSRTGKGVSSRRASVIARRKTTSKASARKVGKVEPTSARPRDRDGVGSSASEPWTPVVDSAVAGAQEESGSGDSSASHQSTDSRSTITSPRSPSSCRGNSTRPTPTPSPFGDPVTASLSHAIVTLQRVLETASVSGDPVICSHIVDFVDTVVPNLLPPHEISCVDTDRKTLTSLPYATRSLHRIQVALTGSQENTAGFVDFPPRMMGFAPRVGYPDAAPVPRIPLSSGTNPGTSKPELGEVSPPPLSDADASEILRSLSISTNPPFFSPPRMTVTGTIAAATAPVSAPAASAMLLSHSDTRG